MHPAAAAIRAKDLGVMVNTTVHLWLDTDPPLPPDQQPPDADTSPEPANDVVEETDPDSETAGGTSPHTEDTT